MTGSVSFDRAADYYDRTRGIPPELETRQTEVLRAALADVPGPTLEVGVGTGRVAVPLALAGQRVLGADLSPQMLVRLRGKQPDLPVVCADAMRLPFGDGVFGSAIAAHLLHLVADWQAVVVEVQRVLRPGGVFLATRGAARSGLQLEMVRRFRDLAGMPVQPGRIDSLDRLDEWLGARGARVDRLPEIETSGGDTAEAMIASIEANVYSWTWPLDEVTRLRAAAELRAWVRTTYGDPAALVLPTDPIRWHRYRMPVRDPLDMAP